MGIFRGEGGTGDSNTDATVTAVTEQATIATTKASEAAASAAEASTSAANSAASASSSSNSSAAAATSATQAATSATASAASATASASSATSAATAQANAETAETNAETAETNAAASATTATTKASEAATSATSASTSASTATTKASEAATSASNAATSETNAATSASTATTKASEASTSASNAATSEANAAASYDDFDDRYLGAKSSAPSTDNDGDALVTGALYFDTSSDSMKVYSGSAWLDAYASLSGALIATNNLSDLNNVGTARTNLGLGTAATTASTDYATAAQGTTADNALPKSGGAMTGAITTNSTFDGRDVSADGTKLDGIEAGATADQTASEIKTAYESNADTNAFTDADHTKLDGIEASADVTDTANVTAAGALMDSELTSEASVKALNQGVATTDSPTFAGLTVDTNTLYVDSTNNRVGVGTTSPNANLDIESSNATLHLTDSDDSTYAEVRNNGGTLTIGSDVGASAGGSSINFKVDNTERMRIDSSGRVGIGTTSPSVPVHVYKSQASPTIVAKFENPADEAIVEIKSKNTDLGVLQFADTEDANVGAVQYSHSDNSMRFKTNDSERMRIDSSGRVGIGTSSPAQALDVVGVIKLSDGILNAGAGGSASVFNEDGTTADFRVESSGNTHMLFVDGGLNRVGIGTSSPSAVLHTKSSGETARFETTDSTGLNYLTFFKPSSQRKGYIGYGGSTSNHFYINNDENADIVFRPNNTEAMRIAANGVITVPNTLQFNTSWNEPAIRFGSDAPFVRSDGQYVYWDGNGTSSLYYIYGFGGVVIDSKTTITDDDGLVVRSSTNAVGAPIEFSDHSSGTYAQKGTLTYYHADSLSYGSGNAFVFEGSETSTSVVGHKAVFENYWVKPSSGTGAGTLLVDSSRNITANYVKADRLYSNDDGSSGHFYNDSGTRTAYANGDFYIQTSVPNYYNYATNQYLGNTSGDIIHTRGNRVTGNNFEFATNGDFYVNAGFGSKGIAYACRAWGRYEMIGTHSWRDDEGFSTISDLGTGRSRIYFTNTMPNSYYSVQVTAGSTGYTTAVCAAQVHTTSTTNFYVDNEDLDSGFTDRDNMHIAVFR